MHTNLEKSFDKQFCFFIFYFTDSIAHLLFSLFAAQKFSALKEVHKQAKKR